MNLPRPWMVTVALGIALATGAAGLYAQGVSTWLDSAATQPDGSPRPLPTTPGHHKLRFQTAPPAATTQDNKPADSSEPVTMAYELYLPLGYDKAHAPFPMVVFLNGAGECGNNLEGIMVHGPSAELVRNPRLAERLPCIVLSPQCPEGKYWDTPGMAQAVIALIRDAESRFHVDPSRVYLTGLSMGGEGTWLIAMAAPELFAAIAPISAKAVEPEAAAARLRGLAIWIIDGTDDGDFTAGSRRMTKALAQAGLDITLTEVPGAGHGAWGRYYPKPGFYQWLLANRRGQPPAPDRLQPAQLSALGMTDTPDMQGVQKLSDEFKKFLPYWQLLNCGREYQPGLKPRTNGNGGVFVTSPLNKDVPCMLQTTWSLPPARKSVLRMLVGRDPQGAWDLVVRADGKVLLSRFIDKATCPTGWADLSVDLSPYAGQAVRLELLNRAISDANPSATWYRVVIEHH